MMTNSIKIKPYLRWAGGKNWLSEKIPEYIPLDFNNYYEPFLGGGSIFISLKSKKLITNKSFLSDQNRDLINSYRIIKNNYKSLIQLLQTFSNDEKYYYKIREKKYDDPVENAARFIYLNKTSYNGLYRENLQGHYNVPFGHKYSKDLYNFENIKNLSKLFKNSYFNCCDFEKIYPNLKPYDFVFLDPPYTVAHQNNGFIKYNQKIFSWEDQLRLRDFIKKIDKKNIYFIITNAAHQNIEVLYASLGKKFELKRHSVIGGKDAKRQEISELIITNCV